MCDVAIVAVNYKMKTDIERCFTSLFADLADDALAVKVVVVDNASGDGIKEFLLEKFPQVVCILQETNNGFGAAQNVGMRSVEAKYYFVLNPDTYFFTGGRLVRRLFDYMEAHPKTGILGPKIVYPGGSLQYSCYRFPTFWQPLFSRTNFGQRGRGKKVNDRALMKDFDHKKTRPVDWVMGSAMFVRGAALKQVGLFDERFWMYYEDSDWCRRMWEAGWSVYYAHDMLLEHVHGRGSAKVLGIFRALIKNKLARVHLASWLKYMWKLRGNYKYYGPRS